jgi:hypothetical protein
MVELKKLSNGNEHLELLSGVSSMFSMTPSEEF